MAHPAGKDASRQGTCTTLPVSHPLMKAKFKVVCTAFLLLILALCIHMIFSQYTSWYFRVPNVQLTVDGKTAQGWLHRGNRNGTLFLTRRDNLVVESYLILPSRGVVWSCGAWTAPRIPAFPIGDVNPPCWTLSTEDNLSTKPIRPARNLTVGTKLLEFTADDGKRIRVSW